MAASHSLASHSPRVVSNNLRAFRSLLSRPIKHRDQLQQQQQQLLLSFFHVRIRCNGKRRSISGNGSSTINAFSSNSAGGFRVCPRTLRLCGASLQASCDGNDKRPSSFVPTRCSTTATSHPPPLPEAPVPTREIGTIVPSFQQAIQRLQDYWASVGCAVMQSSNTEVGAGTMNPATFLRVLGPEPWNVVYVEPSVRPDDSRYGDNPNRLQRHTQFQVILKPDPGNSQELYLGSLAALGIDVKSHDIRFVEDNWESPVLGAWGLGWEVWMDGMEITQFTYFQQAGGMPLMPVSVEITYGLERILMAVQGVNHFKKIQYATGITYGEMFLDNEKEMSTYYLDSASVERVQQQFDLYDAEAQSLLDKKLAIPAYDHVLKASHAFNILDARGAVGVTERARFFGRMRRLARECAQLWVKTRESLDHPLGTWKPIPPAIDEKPVVYKKVKDNLTHTFVLEIGSEELPSQDVSSGIGQLEESIILFMTGKRLKYSQVSVFGTPRRLVVIVNDLAPMQQELDREVKGPRLKAAYNELQHPTRALEEFCKRNNVTGDSLYVKKEGKFEYVYATAKCECRPTIEVLCKGLPSIIGGLTFTKTMRWSSNISYSRPLRWFLALYGEDLIPFSYADVSSGRVTRALRNSSPSVVEVSTAEDYISVLNAAGIVPSMQERKELIWAQSTSLAHSLGGRVPDAAISGLLDEVANLVEAPRPLLGTFDRLFLDLPGDVLTMVMRKHQRYFPVEDPASGKLLPAFIAVANGQVDVDLVRRGNEAVLRARCEDAKFFYNSDLSKPLAKYRQQLSGILFQEKLGTMLDKSIRNEKMILELGSSMGLDDESMATANEAVCLAAADLATAVVKEFTSLAGIMGKHYAMKEGRPAAVANAIFETVLPRHAGDILPTSDAGILLAVADRLDSLVGLFSIGCRPSGSADPLGLRRNAYGLVQTIVENKKILFMDKALKIAALVQPFPIVDAVINEALAFVTRRLEQLLVDRGSSKEIVRAIILERGNNPYVASESVRQLEELEKQGLLKDVILAFSRSTRIAKPELVDVSWEINDLLFKQPEEETLWNAYKNVAAQLDPGVSVDQFIKSSLELVQPLENFFSNVFVLVEDLELQRNRLALLRKIVELPKGILDFSALPGF